MSEKYTIDVRPLKRFAKEKLSHDSVLKKILLEEDDQLPASELLGRVKVWMQLLEIKRRPE